MCSPGVVAEYVPRDSSCSPLGNSVCCWATRLKTIYRFRTSVDTGSTSDIESVALVARGNGVVGYVQTLALQPATRSRSADAGRVFSAVAYVVISRARTKK